MTVKYNWAANPIKLLQAEADVISANKADPTVVVNEETIKAAYVKRLGLVYNTVSESVEEKGEDKVEETDETKLRRVGRPRK